MFFVISSMLSLGIGAFMFSITSTHFLENCIKSVNNCATVKREKSQVIQQIATFIQLHSEVKGLSDFNYNLFTKIYKFLIKISSYIYSIRQLLDWFRHF